MSAKKFHSHVVLGDSITIEKDGRTYVAHIEFDADTNIDDTDSHNVDQSVTGCTDKQQEKVLAAREAWLNGEWRYFGVVVELTCETCGQTVGDINASLWGIEGNYPGDDNAYLTEVANDLVKQLHFEITS